MIDIDLQPEPFVVQRVYPFYKMNVGDSVIIRGTPHRAKMAQVRAHSWARKKRIVFVTKTIEPGVVRITRTA